MNGRLWSSPRRWALVAGGAVVAVLVGVALVRTPEEERVAAGTPEATVKAYLGAIVDRRRTDAFDQLTDELQARCRSTMVADYTYPRIARAALVQSTIDGDEARVVVALTESSGGGLFGVNESTFRETFALSRTAGGWRISTTPWPLWFCDIKVFP